MMIEYDQPNGGNSENDRENEGREGQSGGTGTQRSKDEKSSSDLTNKAGDPGRTPGSAEGVEDFEKTGNE